MSSKILIKHNSSDNYDKLKTTNNYQPTTEEYQVSRAKNQDKKAPRIKFNPGHFFS